MQLPPLQVTRAVVQRYCRVLHRYRDDMGSRPLVLPNGHFFPDLFQGDLESVQALISRMQVHAGLTDIPITVELADAAQSAATSSNCSSGACAVPQNASGVDRLVDLEDSWLIRISASELRHPVALTTNLARSLAFVFLVESQREGELLEPPVDVTADLVAVALGFGPLMLQGSYIYAKSCGGPQIASVTNIGVSELAIAVALFALLGEHPVNRALKELDVTQKSLLSEAYTLLRANAGLISQIQRSPLEVSKIDIRFAPAKSFLARLFARKASQIQSGIRMDAISADMDLDEVEALLIAMPRTSRISRPASTRPRSHSNEELKTLVSESCKEVGL